MASYPSQLPLPMQQGYAIQHQSPFMRTEMQSGRARQRRTFTSVPSAVSAEWFFTTGECQLFEIWFASSFGADDGAAWFQMRLQTPIGIKEYDCRFSEMYQGPRLVAFDNWQISATIEIRERQLASSDYAIIVPEYILLSDIFDKAVNREWTQP